MLLGGQTPNSIYLESQNLQFELVLSAQGKSRCHGQRCKSRFQKITGQVLENVLNFVFFT